MDIFLIYCIIVSFCNKKGYQFTFLWTITAVILLSLVPEKKPRYLLPVLIPLALNTGFYIHYIIVKSKSLLKSDRYIVNFGFGLVGFICLAFPIAGYSYFKSSLNEFWQPFILTSIALFVLGILIFRFLKQKKYENVFYATIIMMCAILFLGLPLAKTFYNNHKFNNINNLRKTEIAKDLKLYGYHGVTPELIWELGEPVKIVKEVENLPKKDTFGLLITEDITPELVKNYNLQPLDTFDINYVSPSKSGYKKRLISKFYLATKK